MSFWTILRRQNIRFYQSHISYIPCKCWSVMPCLVKNGCCLETSWILEIEPILFMFKLG